MQLTNARFRRYDRKKTFFDGIKILVDQYLIQKHKLFAVGALGVENSGNQDEKERKRKKEKKKEKKKKKKKEKKKKKKKKMKKKK